MDWTKHVGACGAFDLTGDRKTGSFLPDPRLSVAPMIDCTDRHCRYFHRLLAPRTLLYTEMITTGALLLGDVERHLALDPSEHPVALQLGGSSPEDLARACRLAAPFGYDEINLNCGCPSARVQSGAFGACLMAQRELVRDCLAAMRQASDVPVTVKSRIGIDRIEDYGFLRQFVDTVATAGVTRFIIHARNAWLDGLSPKKNREVPPLRHDYVHRLARERPDLTIVINGGITTPDQVRDQLDRVDGVMIGRTAYQRPAMLPAFERAAFGSEAATPDLVEVVGRMGAYADAQMARGVPFAAIGRHLLGLFHGLPGARRYRQILSDGMRAPDADCRLLDEAVAAVQLPGRQDERIVMAVH